ncbi:MAG: polysaccharide deacetylase family protein [Oscillospiraceae bacterium]|nr:polysaccharide deacetylase family protein [Oscillospiraceae bacterium]
MKRIAALLLLLAFCALMFALPISAEGEVFVAAGNTILPLTEAMPIYSSGVWYIDYQCFTKGNLNVSTSYNASESTLVLYTWDTTLIFDLNKTVAYTASEKVPYKAVSFVSSGTVYVPVQFTAQMLGLDYTYFSDFPMIRIKRSSDIPSNMFIYIAESEIPKLLDAYNASKNEEGTSSTPSQKPSPEGNNELPEEPDEENPQQKNIRLTFNITNGKNMAKILDALSRHGFRATFFIQGNAMPNCENELRRAVINGHSLGSLSENGDVDFSKSDDELKAALTLANERLFDITRTKTRLVRIPGGSKTIPSEKAGFLISLGYRIWDDTVTPSGTTANRIYSSAVAGLSGRERTTATLTLNDSDISVSALTRILRYLDTNNYRTYTITVLDTPVNDILEKR